MNRTEACLILNMVDHIGPVTVRRLTQRFGNPEAILEASLSDLQSVDGIGFKSAKAISGSTIQNSAKWRLVFEFSARNVGPNV